MSKKLQASNYTYPLPAEYIAHYPLDKRDESRLLVYKKGEIIHSVFKDITQFLPPDATLFFNNTKVIPARLLFQKPTGATIEVFLLEPHSPGRLQENLAHKKSVQWKCTIGNLKRWKEKLEIKKEITLTATLLNREKGIVEFQWDKEISFDECMKSFGVTPLPPYIARPAEKEDQVRYQTLYSEIPGAVAAPTAGLHFTGAIFNDLKKQNFHCEYVTLHVGGGTFQPIKTERVDEHIMHAETFYITKQTLEKWLKPTPKIAVGTTSLRVLESIYWYGVLLKKNSDAPFIISQHLPYQDFPDNELPTPQEAVTLVLNRVKNSIEGKTSILIRPDYPFKMIDGLITNFHQPDSTLLLLVAALIGEDWKKVYNQALQHKYRFLSYGDCSLLFPAKK